MLDSLNSGLFCEKYNVFIMVAIEMLAKMSYYVNIMYRKRREEVIQASAPSPLLLLKEMVVVGTGNKTRGKDQR